MDELEGECLIKKTGNREDLGHHAMPFNVEIKKIKLKFWLIN